MINPKYEPIPAWYKISSKNDGQTLSISIHRVVLRKMMEIDWLKAPIIRKLKLAYNIPNFTAPSEGDWGFSGLIKQGKSNDISWITWDIHLPVLRGNDETILSIRLSLYVLTSLLSTFEEETGWNTNQLILIDGISLPSKDFFANGSISATLTPDAIKWIKINGTDNNKLALVEKEMKMAYSHLCPQENTHGCFRVIYTEPKLLSLHIPGDDCELHPEDSDDNSDSGYKLVSHNVDDGVQQLVLLIGLSKIHDLI